MVLLIFIQEREKNEVEFQNYLHGFMKNYIGTKSTECLLQDRPSPIVIGMAIVRPKNGLMSLVLYLMQL